ncbi:MAG: hypothetical protein M1812_005231 [Candelaria pacifica]|nr:MAG: hypothetical protein M1812_005231 [Candelaria pacifica]
MQFKAILPSSLWSLILVSLSRPSLAQFPASNIPSNLTTILQSPVNSNVTIRYKSPPLGTCTTVFPTQKQYTGYVSLPPFTLAPIQQDYSINTFFWFIEARQRPESAPLTIWLNGGPGSSSMVGLFQETGPCEVVEVARGRFGTQARQWGWDRSSNILFVDQPNQVGFSYDSLTNGSYNFLTDDLEYPAASLPNGQPAYSYLNGTFSSDNASATTNTTQISAMAIWHMLQGFLGSFPQYNPGLASNGTKIGAVGVNLFAESYGGKYGPTFAYSWEQQNMRRLNGSIPSNSTLEIQLRSVGIMQGCIDDLIQAPYYPKFATNNTFGIQAMSATNALNAAGSFLGPGGCQELITSCRGNATSMDPNNDGDVTAVNQICRAAQSSCTSNIVAPYTSSGRSIYDITHQLPESFPPSIYLEYLNTAELQKAIGTSINYTETSNGVSDAFVATGDVERGDQVSQLAYLLSINVRVALVYGDRDFICNWLGGEAVSFAVASRLPSYAPFYAAGYADIRVNDSYVGGAVRQYGNLSFSRVYDAGHLVPAYQPETAFTIFTRVVMGTDVSTGNMVNLTTFGTKGDANATYTNAAPVSPNPTCWVRNINNSCNQKQKGLIKGGQGVVIDGVLYEKESDWKAPASSVSVAAGVPGTLPPAMTATTMAGTQTDPAGMSATSSLPTGVYVATGSQTSKPSAATPLKASNPSLLFSFLFFYILLSRWAF